MGRALAKPITSGIHNPRGRGMTAERKARKIGHARVAIRTVIFALVWHSHLTSAAQPASAQNLVRAPRATRRYRLKN